MAENRPAVVNAVGRDWYEMVWGLESPPAHQNGMWRSFTESCKRPVLLRRQAFSVHLTKRLEKLLRVLVDATAAVWGGVFNDLRRKPGREFSEGAGPADDQGVDLRDSRAIRLIG